MSCPYISRACIEELSRENETHEDRNSKMMIATWNVFKGTTEERAAELRATYSADIIAFQEAQFSEELNSVWRGDPGKTRKGVSLWSQYEHHIVKPSKSVSPSIGVRIENTSIRPLNILNLWAKPNPDYYSDLMNSLQAYDEFIKSGPTIILGDFNISPRVRGKVAQFKKLNAHLEMEYGLTSAYHQWNKTTFGSERSATLYFRWQESSVFHCDYIYVPNALSKFIKSVIVPSFDNFGTSDHRPVICEFDF